MGGGQRNSQVRVGQHHHNLDAGLFGQQFSGAGIGYAGGIDRGLVNRAGNHAVEFTLQAPFSGTQ